MKSAEKKSRTDNADLRVRNSIKSMFTNNFSVKFTIFVDPYLNFNIIDRIHQPPHAQKTAIGR